MKAAVIRAAFGLAGVPGLNRSYRELARHYGFKVDPTPVYAPKKKGKVESSVKYVKNNALLGRTGEEVDDVNTLLARWVREIAGMRIHGSTGRHPLEVFERDERSHLLPLPVKQFEAMVWHKATVPQDVHVLFEGALYSVPWRLAKREVWVRGVEKSVTIYVDDTRVALHGRGAPGSRNTLDEHLPEGRRDLRHRDRGYWEARAAAIGEAVAVYIKEVFDSDDVLLQLRTAQGIVLYLEKLPAERARSAGDRARFYANYTYVGLKRIIAQGLDLEPVPVALVAEPSFRFARNIAELLSANIEVNREPH